MRCNLVHFRRISEAISWPDESPSPKTKTADLARFRNFDHVNQVVSLNWVVATQTFFIFTLTLGNDPI